MICLLISFLLIPELQAQTSSPSKVNLNWTIREGLGASLEIEAAQASQRETDARYKATQAKIFPRVNAVGSGGTRKASVAYGGGGPVGTILDANENYSALLEVQQPLYSGGAISSGLAYTRTNKEVAKQNLFAAKQSYLYQLITNYLNAAEKQLNLDLARDNRDVLKKYFQITSQYAAIGRSKNVDRLQAQSNYNLSEAEVLKAESEFERELQTLFQYMGKETPADSALDTQLVLQRIETGTLPQLYQKALENNPAIRSSVAQVEAQKYLNDTAISAYKPSVNLRGTYGYDSPDRVNLFEKRAETYSITLNLTIPIFAGLESWHQRAINAEQVILREKTLAIQQRDLHNALSQAMASLSRDFDRLKLTQDSAIVSRKAMDVAIRDYRNGLLSSTDVLNIQRTRFESDRQYLAAQYSYHRQVLALRFNLGIDLEKSYGR